MDELRFVRREDQTLVVANDAGQEFRLVADDAVLTELRALSRRDRPAGKVRPREIQSLIRAGKTRAQVMAETGLEEADIERYEEPVLAERRYILERAQAVPVRAEAHADAEQRFGVVIQERLISLGAEASEWSSWRDEETGWMVSLEFISRDVAHRAVWAFDHRKGALSPVNPDAVNLSKQGDVGDRLIPKLRAVDTAEGSGRFDSDAFDTNVLPGMALADELEADAESEADSPAAEPAQAPDHPESADAVYERRREIDQRAIKTNETAPIDLSQTADLLDALRRRRGERDEEHRAAALAEATEDPGAAESATSSPAGDEGALGDPAPETGSGPRAAQPAAADSTPGARARSIWGASGVSGSAPPLGSRGAGSNAGANPGAGSAQQPDDTAPIPGSPVPAPPKFRAVPPPEDTEQPQPQTPGDGAAAKPAKKGRASIPSWDDILFGTRSDDDPS